MATRKQKHEEALARRERFLEEQRRTGLAAQKRDRAERFRQQLSLWEDGHNKKHHRFVDECPHCQIIRAAISRGKTAKEAKDEVESIKSRQLPVPPAIDLNGFSPPVSDGVDVLFSNAAMLPDAASLEMECR